MRLRQLALALTAAGALVAGLGLPADASSAGFTVSSTKVTTGDSVSVSLTDGCRDEQGNAGYGVVDVYNDDTGKKLAQLKFEDATFFTGNSVTFPTAGNYHLSRSCNGCPMGSISVVVSDPAPETTTTTTTVASAPAETTTTTAPAVVESVAEAQPAPAATPVKTATLSYTG